MSYAQPWTELLPTDKKSQDLTLYDYKAAFDAYWAPFDVDKGYYWQDGEKKKAGGWKQFLRWYHDMESQVDPSTGAFPKEDVSIVWLFTPPITIPIG
ncbi:MAG: hypothetical protein CSB02_00150 [Bacteroidia bacterium]|nr:MAG: hypothetical protein CSB02_00150 [Bacteroidia bacterium]